jgi:rapamycin-insensitive companion of mTOR
VQETSLVKDIIDMAENAQILSLRGTCIYIIGMMCRTEVGRKEVQKHNWLFSKSQVASRSVSVCLPRDPRNLFKVETGRYQGSITCQKKLLLNIRDIKQKLPLNNKVEEDILNMIGNLINGVTWQQAYSDLQKEQEKNPKAFLSPQLFEHVTLYLSIYSRLQPKNRKFILNLFDQLIFQNKLLKDRFVHL